MRELEKGIERFELEEQLEVEPQFIFFTKKEHFTFDSQGVVQMGRDQVARASRMLAPLRHNKLTIPRVATQPNEEPDSQVLVLSKKTEELANARRGKMVRDIRERQP